MITMYTTHCPKCKVMEMKLKQKGIEYTECDNIDEMLEKGLRSAPVLDVDGQIMDFVSGVAWINSQKSVDKAVE